jgi:hypothetical protein
MAHPEPWLGAKPMTPAPAAHTAPRRDVAAAADRPSQSASSGQPIAASSSGKRDASSLPPKDAQFTLYCADYTGPAHVEIANRAKQELAQLSGMRGWYIVHQTDRSTLFYGYYNQIDDANMKRDRAALEALEDRAGDKIIRAAIAVPVDAPDPDAPPEWNLANVRRGDLDTRHFWTIQVGAYKDSPERKQAAVEAVRAARQSGIDAYYYHGETVSSVCIGVWPQEALRIDGVDQLPGAGGINGGGGSIRASSSDPDEALLVAPGINVPEKLKAAAGKRNVSVAQPKVTIIDPSMERVKRQFNEHAINGMVEMMVNQQGQHVPRPSLVVQIPVGEPGSTAFNPPTPAPPPDAVRALTPDAPPPSSGGGKLKSIRK